MIRYNGTIYEKSLELLKILKFDDKTWNSLYRRIYGAISRNWRDAEKNCLQKVTMMIEDKTMEYKFV